MSGVNLWIGIGNLGRDPEVRNTGTGKAVCNFSIACNEQWKDKQGQKQEKCEWINVVAWDKLAELCGKYLAKGKQCWVEGKLQTRKWQDKDGHDRWTTEVVARNVVFLSPASGAQSAPPPAPVDDDVPY